MPVAQQREVLGDHDAHGSSARTVVGPPAGLSRRQRAVERLDALAQAVEPAAARRRRRRRRRRATSTARPAPSRRARSRTRRSRRGVLGGVGERLGDDEVGGGLDRRRTGARRARRRPSPGSGAARGQRLQRLVQAALGQQRRADAAREVAQLGQRARASPRAPRVSELARAVAARGRRAAPRPSRGPSPSRPAAPARRRAGRARCARSSPAAASTAPARVVCERARRAPRAPGARARAAPRSSAAEPAAAPRHSAAATGTASTPRPIASERLAPSSRRGTGRGPATGPRERDAQYQAGAVSSPSAVPQPVTAIVKPAMPDRRASRCVDEVLPGLRGRRAAP